MFNYYTFEEFAARSARALAELSPEDKAFLRLKRLCRYGSRRVKSAIRQEGRGFQRPRNAESINPSLHDIVQTTNQQAK